MEEELITVKLRSDELFHLICRYETTASHYEALLKSLGEVDRESRKQLTLLAKSARDRAKELGRQNRP